MPGILPMKVIRVGGNAQSRIAQACDRCRSKKIRCDGVRPCCTQCSNVGFECKTSDKLSRRAFPRGYTESLEDRVRQLESEVRELKDLLDEKDEKIDMLSRLQSFSPTSRKNSRSLSPSAATDLKSEVRSETAEESIEVVAPTTNGSTPPAATSSTTTFIESFKCNAAVHGRAGASIRTHNLKPIVRPSSPGNSSPKTVSRAPPRLLSDQYINIFLQEWATLFPILNRSAFLRTYQEFLAEPESPQWQNRKHDVAQLFLVFDLASTSAKSSSKQSSVSYEHEWRRAMQAMTSTPSLATLQCHILAQLVYLLKSDQKHFLRHRASAVTICHQLGLHLSQDQLSLGVFEREVRKRVFWTQYIIDRFGASTCGVPLLLRESDISTEYPTDVDDENISEAGIQTGGTGETKMSNTLALIGVTRILTKVLEDIHPQALKYDLPLKKIRTLTDELDQWNESLPQHLRLKFINDKPSTGIISDRSPLLSLAEFHTRLLISRPVMCFASGNSAASAVLASANAAKHMAQICDLLDERSMNYAFPLSKVDLLLSAGFTLLWQALELAPGSKLVKDNQKSLALVTQMLRQESENVGVEFTKIIKSLNLPDPTAPAPVKEIEASKSMKAPEKSSTRKHLQAIASRFSTSSFGTRPKPDQGHRRETVSSAVPPINLGQYGRNFSQLSISSARSEPAYPGLSPTTSSDSAPSQGQVNLDYYPLGNESVPNLPILPHKDQVDSATWEQLLASIDSGDANIYSGIYGGLPPSEAFPHQATEGGLLNVSDVDPSALSLPMATTNLTQTAYDDPTFWSQGQDAVGSWPNATTSLVDLQNSLHRQHSGTSTSIPAQSVVSYGSEDSNGTGEDFHSLNSAMSTSAYSHTSISTGSARRASSNDGGMAKMSHTNSFEDHGDTSSYGGIVMPNLVDGTGAWE